MSLKDILRKTTPAPLLRLAARLRSIVRNRHAVGASTTSVFQRIYENHNWGGESVSGHGSDLKQTESVRANLPALLKKYPIRSMLDAPCGAFNWMQLVDLGGIEYIGGDIVPELIKDNVAKYEGPLRHFEVVNLISDPLPRADLLFCRDCLIHLSLKDAAAALRNVAGSGIPYILTTTYPNLSVNTDIITGDFRAVNLQIAPFNFPAPLASIPEDDYPELKGNPNFTRQMSLWRTKDLLQHPGA